MSGEATAERISPAGMAEIYMHRARFHSIAQVQSILQYFGEDPTSRKYWQSVLNILKAKLEVRNHAH